MISQHIALSKKTGGRDSILNSLIMPYFVVAGRNIKDPLQDLSGIYKFSPDLIIRDIERAFKSGISKVMLFDILEAKERNDSHIPAQKLSILSEAISNIKHRFPRLTIIADLCVCSGTASGQCRLVKGKKYSTPKTLEALKTLAVSYAKSGADILSPSGMLQSEVIHIKQVLKQAGFAYVKVMPCIKFASHLYLPARRIFGAKNTTMLKPYHLPAGERKKVLRRIKQDIKQGADIIMIKPALYNLDIIYAVRNEFGIPVAGFMPSGSYRITKKGTEDDFELEKNIILEELSSLRRAGCSGIVTYYANQIADWLKGLR